MTSSFMGILVRKGREAMLCCLDLTFMMGSMGSVVGETITRAVEAATPDRATGDPGLPVIIVSCSGGARMQESGLSLMQMAKTCGALARFDDAGGLFISVLTDPSLTRTKNKGGVAYSQLVLRLLRPLSPEETAVAVGFKRALSPLLGTPAASAEVPYDPDAYTEGAECLG